MARIVHTPDVELVQLNRGDTLICQHLSDLAPCWPRLQPILALIAERGVSLVVRRSSRKPDELIQVWAKRDLRRAAYDRAHARGAYALNTGRPRKADPALAQKLKDSGLSFEMIATTLGVSPRTLHRYFKT